MWSRGSAVFMNKCQNGDEDQSDFDHGMTVGARQGGMSISKADLLENALLMREVRGEGPNWSKLTGR